MNDRLLLRPAEAAIALGISRARVYELVAQRVIPSIRIGSAIRVPAIQLQAWVERQTREAEGEVAGR